MIVEALINDGTIDSVKQFSSVQNIQNRFTSLLSSPQLSVESYDSNGDLRNEMIKITFDFNHATTETVKSLHILFYLQYYIGNEINAQFKTLLYLTLDASNGDNISVVKSKGRLNLVQKSPIEVGTIKRELYSSTLENDYFNYGIQGILDLYSTRNITTEYDAFTSIVPALPAKSTTTNVELTIEIPTYQKIWYFTTILQMSKYAWMQYFAFIIPFYFVFGYWEMRENNSNYQKLNFLLIKID